MGSKLERVARGVNAINITNSLATSSEIDFEKSACLILCTPSGWTSATVSVYVRDPLDDTTYRALKNAAGDAVQLSVGANECREFASSLFAASHIKLVASSSDNNAIDCGVLLKG